MRNATIKCGRMDSGGDVVSSSNDDMLKMMARENNETFDANALMDIELVQLAIQAHAKGEIILPSEKGNQVPSAKGRCIQGRVVEDRGHLRKTGQVRARGQGIR